MRRYTLEVGGKPIVIEEMFPLSCSVDELDQFMDGSKSIATGWLFGAPMPFGSPEHRAL